MQLMFQAVPIAWARRSRFETLYCYLAAKEAMSGFTESSSVALALLQRATFCNLLDFEYVSHVWLQLLLL